MVKLTPKLITTEFPDEDLPCMRKLTLPGKGIEKVELLGCASSATPSQQTLICTLRRLSGTADQIGSQQQQADKLGGRQPKHHTQVAVCSVQPDHKPDWHRLTKAATGAGHVAAAYSYSPFAT